MKAFIHTHARQHLAAVMDEVIDNHDIAIITRGGDKAVVMMSLEDYNSWEETSYLLTNPENARHLLRGIEVLV